MNTKFLSLLLVIGLVSVCLVNGQSPSPAAGESPAAAASPAKKSRKKAKAEASPAESASPAAAEASASPAKKSRKKEKAASFSGGKRVTSGRRSISISGQEVAQEGENGSFAGCERISGRCRPTDDSTANRTGIQDRAKKVGNDDSSYRGTCGIRITGQENFGRSVQAEKFTNAGGSCCWYQIRGDGQDNTRSRRWARNGLGKHRNQDLS